MVTCGKEPPLEPGPWPDPCWVNNGPPPLWTTDGPLLWMTDGPLPWLLDGPLLWLLEGPSLADAVAEFAAIPRAAAAIRARIELRCSYMVVSCLCSGVGFPIQ